MTSVTQVRLVIHFGVADSIGNHAKTLANVKLKRPLAALEEAACGVATGALADRTHAKSETVWFENWSQCVYAGAEHLFLWAG